MGVTAAAHLAPLCDYADLDGPLLIKNDPYHGLKYEGAKFTLPDPTGHRGGEIEFAWNWHDFSRLKSNLRTLDSIYISFLFFQRRG